MSRQARRSSEIIKPLAAPIINEVDGSTHSHRRSNSWTLSECEYFSDSDDEANGTATQLAEQLTCQRWHEIGNGPGPISSSSDLNVMVDQLSCILALRLRDLLLYWMGALQQQRDTIGGGGEDGKKKTQDITCKNNTAMEFLKLDRQIGDYVLVDSIQKSIREYVTAIGQQYNQVGFHSFEHCSHVTISMNKLLSMVGVSSNYRDHMKHGRSERNFFTNQGGPTSHDRKIHSKSFQHHRGGVENFSFGIGEDPRILFAMVFSALIHDVGHTGVPNSVLVEEEDELAILHNDVSVAEQHSLQVAFSLLQKDEFASLKRCICPTPEERKFFRKKVINMVMVTDISDQERIQIVKSRWMAAFPSPTEGEGAANPANKNGTKTCSSNGSSAKGVAPKKSSPQHPGRNEIQSQELKSSIRRRRFTMFTSDAAAEEFANNRRSHRLGIRTSMDFSGMLLDAYRTMDQLQQHAVLETMMNVADVAHTMQSFSVFVKWNKRLYKEFYVAHLSNRLSFDPSNNWYENQIGFFSHYIIPLSQKMKTCGVFGTTGTVFEYFATENKKRWVEDGEAISEEIIRDVREEVEMEQGLRNGCNH